MFKEYLRDNFSLVLSNQLSESKVNNSKSKTVNFPKMYPTTLETEGKSKQIDDLDLPFTDIPVGLVTKDEQKETKLLPQVELIRDHLKMN